MRDIPTPPYDAGDQWTNATFPDEYNNDLLCLCSSENKWRVFLILRIGNLVQNLTSAQFKSEIKTAAKNISATVTNLKNGLVEVGFELDGEKRPLMLLQTVSR